MPALRQYQRPGRLPRCRPPMPHLVRSPQTAVSPRTAPPWPGRSPLPNSKQTSCIHPSAKPICPCSLRPSCRGWYPTAAKGLGLADTPIASVGCGPLVSMGVGGLSRKQFGDPPRVEHSRNPSRTHAWPTPSYPSRFHPRRTARGDRDHRHPHRPAPAGRAVGAGGGAADGVRQQSQANVPGVSGAPRRQATPALCPLLQ